MNENNLCPVCKPAGSGMVCVCPINTTNSNSFRFKAFNLHVRQSVAPNRIEDSETKIDKTSNEYGAFASTFLEPVKKSPFHKTRKRVNK